jgi:hypothetical protein
MAFLMPPASRAEQNLSGSFLVPRLARHGLQDAARSAGYQLDRHLILAPMRGVHGLV